MANALDALIDRIPDEALRGQIREALKKQNQQKKFGLVFEDHIPESTVLYDVPVKAGSTVALRGGDVSKQMKVLAIDGEVAHCLSLPEREPVDQPLDSLVSVAKFGEPIYPYLKQLDTVCNAPDSDLWHTLIEADNYHALQLLEYLYAEKVDCIYIDPPYNTGEDEWKYNDAFVDKNDQWQHSKWLSFIKKRLKIAKRLLNPKGVLIISIGYQQINRLNLLLEELFPEKQIVTVTVQTSGGKPSGGFNYLQEYLVFIVPKDFEPMPMLFSGGKESSPYHGMTLASFTQSQRPNQTYPIYIENESGKITGCGKSLQERVRDGSYSGSLDDFVFDYDEAPANCSAVWPVTTKGLPCVWRLIPSSFLEYVNNGYIRVIRQKQKKNNSLFGVQFLADGIIKKIKAGIIQISGKEPVNGALIIEEYKTDGSGIPTIWSEKQFYTSKGTSQIQNIMGGKDFPYPKPIDLILEALRSCTSDDSLIVDFFAGSGTTLNAVNLLNSQDDGQRRCLIVTNNELSKKQTKELLSAGIHPRETQWESKGICKSVTWPRIVSTTLGKRNDGTVLQGEYSPDGDDYKRPYAEGFKSNCIYFKLGFLNKTSIAVGRQFCELLPLLWLKAGAHNPCPVLPEGSDLPDLLVLPENRFAALLSETAFAEFSAQVKAHPEINTLYIVTDSEPAFRMMTDMLPGRTAYQLYRDYLENFQINLRR